VKRAAGLGLVAVCAFVLFFLRSLPAQEAPASATTVAGKTMVVIPFENISPTPGLEWIGESFPESFHQQLDSPVLYVASRDERLRAYDRQGVPASVHPSRATIYRMAEQMDVDYAVLGSYKYDGISLTATAQLLDMRAPKLLSEVSESAPLANLGVLQAALAWDLLHQIRSDFPVAKEKYIASVAPVRLDALENYVRGILAASDDEKLQHFREATRLNPAYSEAWLELGKTYYRQHAYEPAIAALGQILQTSEIATEANFYLGLSAYAHGDFAKSQSAFDFVAARLPLAEVYNNLGVVSARRGQKKATDYFNRAIEDDPSDADYHFNLGLTLSETGDRTGAEREMRVALDRRPNDAEAKTLLDSLSSATANVATNNSSSKAPLDRLVIKHNYEEDTFRQMTMQMGSWAEEQFARSDPHSHARFHVELGNELLAHGFTTEAESEFHHAAAIDPASSAPFIALARLDLQQDKTESAAQNIDKALQLDPGNRAAQNLKQNLAAKLAEKAQPLQ
jgi:tetratricopeptide (TPR) repeat protein